jgi:hypothetical protein
VSEVAGEVSGRGHRHGASSVKAAGSTVGGLCGGDAVVAADQAEVAVESAHPVLAGSVTAVIRVHRRFACWSVPDARGADQLIGRRVDRSRVGRDLHRTVAARSSWMTKGPGRVEMSTAVQRHVDQLSARPSSAAALGRS